MVQRQLEFDARDRVPRTRYEKWWRFHSANPDVFKLFQRHAITALTLKKKVGARLIGERLRWDLCVKTDESSPSINDHYWPYYARLLMLVDKRFEDFFSVRDRSFDSTSEQILYAHRVKWK